MPFWDYLFYNEAQRTLKKGIALIKSKQYEEAIPLLDKVIRKNPGHFLYYYLRGAAWLNLGQSERAFTDCETALRLNPKHGPTRHNLGVIYLRQQQFQSAIDQFSAAIGAGYNSRSARAQARLKCGDLDGALEDISEAIGLEPNARGFLVLRAAISHRRDDLPRAVDDLKSALELDPNDASAHNNLAWLLATAHREDLRDGAGAVKHALKAVGDEKNPQLAYIGTLAAAYAEAGNFEEAVKWAVKFLESNPPEENVELARQRLELYRQHKPYRQEPGRYETVRDNRPRTPGTS